MNTFFTPKTSKMKWLLSCVIVLSFLVSCADETMLNSTDVKQTTEKNIGETSRIGISGNACVELADVSSSLDGNTTTTRAVSVNSKYLPVIEGTELKARIFIVRVDKNAKTMIDGKEAMDGNKVVLGAGEVKFDKVSYNSDGSIDVKTNDMVEFHWLNDKAFTPKQNEEWYVCGIIGGEYNPDFDRERKNMSLDDKTRRRAEKLYHFYVDFDPNHSPYHNQLDANGNIRVTVPYATGWMKLQMKDGKINFDKWKFRLLGTMIRFKVKRNTDLVKPEGHKYAFASSQITARGGFLMILPACSAPMPILLWIILSVSIASCALGRTALKATSTGCTKMTGRYISTILAT